MDIHLTEGQLAVLVTALLAAIAATYAVLKLNIDKRRSLENRMLTLEIEQRSILKGIDEVKALLRQHGENSANQIEKLNDKVDALQLQLNTVESIGYHERRNEK